MARTALTVQAPSIAGVTTTRNSADQANGNSFVWPGAPVTINVLNTNGSARNMTLKANAATPGGMALADKVYNIPATTGDKTIVLADPAGIVQTDGSVYLDWDASAGVTIALSRS